VHFTQCGGFQPPIIAEGPYGIGSPSPSCLCPKYGDSPTLSVQTVIDPAQDVIVPIRSFRDWLLSTQRSWLTSWLSCPCHSRW
jgi:hypothetical protein